MILERERFDAGYQIEMTDLRIVANPAGRRVDYAESDSHSFADLIAKEKAVAEPLKKRRQHRHACEREDFQFACPNHQSPTWSCFIRCCPQNFRHQVGLPGEPVMLDCIAAADVTHFMATLLINYQFFEGAVPLRLRAR